MPEGDTLAPINLALQGGGSHGALTWGVLDALLEDGRLLIDGISGTSAGAMNAVVVAHGFAQAAQQHKDPKEAHAAGCELARAGLTRLWEGVGTLGSLMWGTPLAARQVDHHRVLGHLLGQPQVDDQHTQIQRDEQHDRRDETAWRANQGADWNGHGEMAYPRIVVSEGKWSECPVIGLKRSSLKPIKKKRPEGRLRRCAKRGAQFSKRASRAAMAGRVLPSRNSRKAPPPVEM